MLEIRNIRKYYENDLLLEDISFTLGADETVCLLGPSGGGKSTLLRIIAGLEEAASGQVLWDGQDITRQPAHLRNFGLMFQDYALFPHLNVSENVAFGLRMQHLPEDEIRRRVAETLALVNMGAFAKRRVTDLSGGEQQRVALARALVPHPRLLMLDEPLGALDRALREQLSADLRAVLEQMDIPVIYVTHDQEEAFAFGDRLFILHDGRIIQSGSPAQVYNHPDSLWLATFFGHKNQLPGEVAALDPLTVQTADGRITCGPQPHEFRPGQAVTLVLPVDAARISGEADKGLQARVLASHFQGMGHLVDLELKDGVRMTFFFKQALQPGSTVELAIDVQSVLCFPAG
ncbi:MAG: thiamine transport system ATP-binding protein [Chloroflexota bacterium]|nr:thiamine transport system ATP-binding protein [Chloroflexota bacterium]